MKNKSRSRVSILYLVRYFIISLLILSAISLAIFTYIETNIVKSHVEQVLSEEMKILRTHEKLFFNELEQTINDVDLLKEYMTLLLEKEKNYKYIGEQWLVFASCRKAYEKLRFIDTDGQTVIDIRNDKEFFGIVDNIDPINEFSTDFFSISNLITDNQIYISLMGICNVSNNDSDLYKPTIELSSKIYNSDNEYLGMLVVDYLIESFLDDLDNKVNQHNGEISILDEEGYYLKKSVDNEKVYSICDSSKTTFGDSYPEIWISIAKGIEKIETEDDIIAVKKVSLKENVKSNISDLVFDRNNLIFLSQVSKSKDCNMGLDDNLSVIVSIILRDKWWSFVIVIMIALIVSLLAYVNKINYRRLKYFSEYDGLTNILNRRSGTYYLEKLINKNKASDSNLCICFMDIDELKCVNDKFGHDTGDELICTVVDCVEKNIRKNDLFIRLGGDEFLIALNSVNVTEGQLIVDQINNDIDFINEMQERPYTVRVSSGLVNIKDIDNHDIDYLIKLADMRMYTNKENKDKSSL